MSNIEKPQGAGLGMVSAASEGGAATRSAPGKHLGVRDAVGHEAADLFEEPKAQPEQGLLRRAYSKMSAGAGKVLDLVQGQKTGAAASKPGSGSLVNLRAGAVEVPPSAKVEPVPVSELGASVPTAPSVKDPSATEVFSAPTSTTSTTVRFELGGYSGKEIKPGERWLFKVPEAFRNTPIRTAILAHRKDAKYAHTYVGERDKEGAYNLVTARKTGTDQWVTWSDQYGSKKFAERRSAGDPENENLHDWVAAVGEQNVDMLSIQNVGVGANAIAHVHMLEIEFFPPGKPAGAQQEIFTPGTEFADLAKGKKKPRFGGGMGSALSADALKTQGLYPNAVELGGYGPSGTGNATLAHAYVSGGKLRIKLPEGKRIGSVEVACGDTEFNKNLPADQQRNKDGHIGKLGWAKLYGRIVNGHTRSQDFMVNVNVPPAGVLSGGPADPNYITQPGDEIEIESRGHRSWVMGYRVQFIE